jgi:hypothetical protein
VKPRKPVGWPTLVLAGIILLAAALRLWRLPTLPPGLWYDEAVNGVDVRMMLAGRGLPLYFIANNGREPLFIYLQALSVALLGYTPYALRVVAALTGILTVPAVYACARALWPHGDNRDPWPALIAAAGLAVSYWHLSLSRLGLRAILLPLVSALAVAFFWRAWTTGRRRDFTAAGASFAVALYTYTAARLLPLVPLAFIVIEALIDWVRVARLPAGSRRAAFWETWRTRLQGLAWLAAAGALLTVPLAVAAWQAPAVVLGRAAQVSVFDTAHPNLLANSLTVARGFYDAGDHNLRHNLPGRPVNDVLLAALFTLGWLAAFRRIRRPQNRLLLIWFGLMLVPTLFSTEAPHSLRAVGALPPLALLYGLGARALLHLPQLVKRTAALSRFVAAKHLSTVRRLAPLALLIAVVVFSGGLTARDYFVRWANSARLWDSFNLPQQLAAEAAAQQLSSTTPQHPLLLPYDLFVTPQMVFAVGVPAQTAPPRGAAPRFILPDDYARGRPTYFLWQEAGNIRSAGLEPLSPGVNDALSVQLAGRKELREIAAPGSGADWPRLWEGSLPPEAQFEARHIAVPLDVTFANGLRLTGYDVQPDVVMTATQDAQPSAATQATITLFWQLNPQHARADVTTSQAFVQLSHGNQVLQTDNGYLTEDYLLAWGIAGRTLQEIRTLDVPAETPPGRAYFQVGLYHLLGSGAGAAQRVDIVDPQGRDAGDHANLGAVMVGTFPLAPALKGARPLGARFDGRIVLAHWAVAHTTVGWQVQLAWQALARSTSDYTVFVHLLDAQGQIIAQCDRPPGGLDNPTTLWVPGEQVLMTCQLPPPPDKAVGLRLRVGLYEPASGRRLPVTGDSIGEGGPGEPFFILPLEP